MPQAKQKRPITFEEALTEWDKKLEPEYEDDRNCTQLSAEDYRILNTIRWKI
jgi:hypothetical protein